jgi:hypothetical protein
MIEHFFSTTPCEKISIMIQDSQCWNISSRLL